MACVLDLANLLSLPCLPRKLPICGAVGLASEKFWNYFNVSAWHCFRPSLLHWPFPFWKWSERILNDKLKRWETMPGPKINIWNDVITNRNDKVYDICRIFYASQIVSFSQAILIYSRPYHVHVVGLGFIQSGACLSKSVLHQLPHHIAAYQKE